MGVYDRAARFAAQAKGVRPFIEKLIALAKQHTPHGRRLVLARLGPPSKVAVIPVESVDDPKDVDERHVMIGLFAEIAPRYAERQGGYTRVPKRQGRRLGDAGPTALLERVEAGSGKRVKKARPAAPRTGGDCPGDAVRRGADAACRGLRAGGRSDEGEGRGSCFPRPSPFHVQRLALLAG